MWCARLASMARSARWWANPGARDLRQETCPASSTSPGALPCATPHSSSPRPTPWLPSNCPDHVAAAPGAPKGPRCKALWRLAVGMAGGCCKKAVSRISVGPGARWYCVGRYKKQSTSTPAGIQPAAGCLTDSGPTTVHADSACSTASLASSRLLKNRVGWGMALGRWGGAGHRRSSIQTAVQPPMSLRLMEQSACPSIMAVQVVGGLWSQVTCVMAPSCGCWAIVGSLYRIGQRHSPTPPRRRNCGITERQQAPTRRPCSSASGHRASCSLGHAGSVYAKKLAQCSARVAASKSVRAQGHILAALGDKCPHRLGHGAHVVGGCNHGPAC